MAFCLPLTVGNSQLLSATTSKFTNSRKQSKAGPAQTPPTRYAKPNFKMSTENSTRNPESARFGMGPNDLLVVGAGNLGMRAARQWREQHPDALVMTATWSEARHAQLAAEGFIPVLSSQLPTTRVPYVLFCAPPSRRQELSAYVADIRRAGALATRRFVFTSATSVYVDDGQSIITERSPVGSSPRARRMLLAESMAFATNRETAVLRLGLLYDLTNGCHPWWLGTGNQYPAGPRNSVYNVIHYDDAATAAVKTLLADRDAGEVFIAVDCNPVTSEQMVRAAMMHPLYKDSPLPIWSGSQGYKKIVNGNWSQEVLGWSPRWPSFMAFFDAETRRVRGEGVML